MNKVVITGATSMIGIALINKLIEYNIECVAIIRPNSSKAKRIPDSKLVSIVECNLNEMEKIDTRLLEGSSALFHLAWDGTGKKERLDAIIQQKNIKYTLDAVELAKRCGCTKFIGAGSQAEYGRCLGMISINTATNPEIAYGIAKDSAGKLSRIQCDKNGMEHIWTRIFSIYGPYDNENTLISKVLTSLLNGKNVDTTLAKQKWDYLYVNDVAEALYRIGLKGKRNSIYNIGSGEIRTLEEYLKIIEKIIHSRGTICYGRIPYSEKQVMHLQADISNLVEDTGFQPKYTFEEGIKETALWMEGKVING